MTKTHLDIAIEGGQNCLKSSPVIVLGSGASIPFGIPSMTDLASHLMDVSIDAIDGISEGDRNLWGKFISELKSQDLERSLQKIQLADTLSDYVVKEVWQKINQADISALDTVVNDFNYLTLARLYRYLFQSTNEKISVVTPNYDRLAEYAASVAGYSYYKGFSYGYIQFRQSESRLSLHKKGQQERTIDIWKVHGCLDWFVKGPAEVIAVTSARTIPDGWTPAIVTPGIGKYSQTHQEPFRSIISGADDALTSAKAYLCVGFGFNDTHIQPKLLERWRIKNAFLVVLAKKLSDNVRKMFAEAKGQHYLAFEESNGGTLMFSNQFPEGEYIEGIQLWQLSSFLDQTT